MSLTPANTAAILLAAGAASRFGADKLSAPLRGARVIDHAAAALTASGCAHRAVIVNSENVISGLPGFETVINPDAAKGLSTSIRIGVNWAEACGAKGVLIALADMPFVDPDHYVRLFETANANRNQCAFTAAGEKRSPPAIFSAGWFSQLRDLEGDQGAKHLLSTQPKAAGVSAQEKMLADIDTSEDLIRFEKSASSVIS
ncbi:nucleotidyltransferase family protein [Hyphococcus sp.]|uniref:nucleotidyltransferase family protein n=1 Tax=Hyphococcus sp. TaxID=2038636 RepID=UPI003D0FF077